MNNQLLDTSILSSFASGGLALGLWFSALFFFQSYRRSKDRFYIFLALSFCVMMVDRLIWGLCGKSWFVEPLIDLRTLVYTIRFAGFAIIAFGIIDRNTRLDKSKPDKPALALVANDRKRA